MRVLAGIVLYNPDIDRLYENYTAIISQVDSVLFINNGSDNWHNVKSMFQTSDIQIIDNDINKGIAFALKQIMDFAIKQNFDWVITLDQDSVCNPSLVEEYKKYVDLKSVGILTCNIQDRNFKIHSEFYGDQKWKEIPQCITSASFVSVDAYKKTDGFDTKMFIDSVDFDICLNMRKYGYKIYRINFAGLLHEVGRGKNVKFLFKKYIIYNHSETRNYYMARNHCYLVKKYPEYFSISKEVMREVRRELLILFYERNRLKKLSYRWKGIIDSIKMNV